MFYALNIFWQNYSLIRKLLPQSISKQTLPVSGFKPCCAFDFLPNTVWNQESHPVNIFSYCLIPWKQEHFTACQAESCMFLMIGRRDTVSLLIGSYNIKHSYFQCSYLHSRSPPGILLTCGFDRFTYTLQQSVLGWVTQRYLFMCWFSHDYNMSYS